MKDVEIFNILQPTREAFIPLLRANLRQITKTPKKTFKYGKTDRHQVDVYYPSDETEGAPILFFVYGGGFLMGSRDVIPGLVYDNLGAFFAQRGILTVVADYRLAPAAVYPEPVEDLRDAFKFVLSELAGHDKTRVYVAGHSAGACHVMTLFLNEDILRGEDRRVFRGAVLMGGHYANAPPPANVYYGPEEDHTAKTPFGLLRSHSAAKAMQLFPSRLFVLHSEREPPSFIAMSEELQRDLSDRGIPFQAHIMKGHNHISVEMSLSSGEGEEWGEEVAKWIKT